MVTVSLAHGWAHNCQRLGVFRGLLLFKCLQARVTGLKASEQVTLIWKGICFTYL